MASLNTSANGPSIRSSYQKIVDATIPQGASPTYSQWAVFSIQTPLTSAFQQDSTKVSVLKVQSSADGELADLFEEFSEGRVQFAFAKVRDPNSALPKCVLIAWCGEGVPERTKGYFGNYLAVVSKLLHGYHVQITARSDNDLSPESLIQKVSDSSGSRYGGGPSISATSNPAPPSLPNKPTILPTRSAAPIVRAPTAGGVDADGWGADAPQVSRSQLEKVESAYKPTKVNMAELMSQKAAPSFQQSTPATSDPDVVRGGYQPVGKVDIAAIRRQAQQNGSGQDDRPTVVKGSYEPVGKVDIAAIKARAQPPRAGSGDQDEVPSNSLADRSAAFQQQSSERLTSLPKPKIANRFGSQASFAGTKAPTPEPFSGVSVVGPAPVGGASRSFADQDGKTPAQLWAEKKAQQGGQTQRNSIGEGPASPNPSQASGGWQSGYTGKKWGAVSTSRAGASNISADATGRSEDADSEQAQVQVSSLKDRFAQDPVQDSPPPPVMSSKPASAPRLPPSIPAEQHYDIPPPPPQPRSPSPEPSGSPPRIAMPVSRTAAPHEIESQPPPTIPVASLATVADDSKTAREAEEEDQQARATAQASAAPSAAPDGNQKGKRAVVQFDYEKAEDNEIELKEGEHITDIEMVDADWWLGLNSAGERGLFPSNYVELVESDPETTPAAAPLATQVASQPAAPTSGQHPATSRGATATAQFDYEAAEDNELSFPDGAKITNVEFPDEDWWLGEYDGRKGLFPANYVTLDQ